MKKAVAVGFSIFMFLPGLFSEDKGSPAATVTEITGLVEIQREHGWERLAPLQPLWAGDAIRVIKPGKAVLLHLGGTAEEIADTNSPYIVERTTLGKSISPSVRLDPVRNLVLPKFVTVCQFQRRAARYKSSTL